MKWYVTVSFHPSQHHTDTHTPPSHTRVRASWSRNRRATGGGVTLDMLSFLTMVTLARKVRDRAAKVRQVRTVHGGSKMGSKKNPSRTTGHPPRVHKLCATRCLCILCACINARGRARCSAQSAAHTRGTSRCRRRKISQPSIRRKRRAFSFGRAMASSVQSAVWLNPHRLTQTPTESETVAFEWNTRTKPTFLFATCYTP